MWIVYSFIYAIFNALYLNFNERKHYNGYLLGIIRGFGVSLFVSPLLYFTTTKLNGAYLSLLILQGILIGVYDSHIFMSSSMYGVNSTFGFMATSVLITLVLWWGIEFNDFITLTQNPTEFLSLLFILSGISVFYWQMMKVKIKFEAEKFLYPAVIALSVMSIATRYIALMGGKTFDGIIYYLFIACFVSGIYNLTMFKIRVKEPNNISLKLKDIVTLIIISTILIGAKTIAFREAHNPSYVMSLLLTSPILAHLFRYKRIKVSLYMFIFILFIILLIAYSLYAS
ncbi:MAG: hypothetical protein IKW58_00585 [Alphaproteobacteria bacterium]|nr:hypothetical protein [Alphaproteobacteria bacterium]